LFHMSEEIFNVSKGAQMNALVALDPAGNIPLLSGYNSSQIDFKKFSTTAIAFECSLIAGSDSLAGTADMSFHINSPQTSDLSIPTEHSLPVTTFASILNHERIKPGKFSNYLSLQRIMDPTLLKNDLLLNAYSGVFEGI